MSDIVFARTNWVYESYADFWSLVQLAGFPVIPVSEVDISKEVVYITSPMNRDWRLHINNEHQKRKPLNAHLILWNLERPSGSAGSVGEYARQCRYLQYGLWENGQTVNENGDESYGRFIDEIWVSDRQLAEETHHATRFVVLGSHEGLGSVGDNKTYDFCHMSYEVPRRQTIYYSKYFAGIKIGPNCWPPERDEVLRQSRFALNVHQDQHPFQEPLRFALFAAYGLPIASENIFDAYPWTHDDTMIITGYDGLVGKLNQMLNEDYGRWREMGLRAREMMCFQFEFGKIVRQAVSESTERWR